MASEVRESIDKSTKLKENIDSWQAEKKLQQTVLVSQETKGKSGKEGCCNLNLSSNNKWCKWNCPTSNGKAWAQFDFGVRHIELNSQSLVTANKRELMDPREWVLYAQDIDGNR